LYRFGHAGREGQVVGLRFGEVIVKVIGMVGGAVMFVRKLVISLGMATGLVRRSSQASRLPILFGRRPVAYRQAAGRW